jgi:hypothetical protein
LKRSVAADQIAAAGLDACLDDHAKLFHGVSLLSITMIAPPAQRRKRFGMNSGPLGTKVGGGGAKGPTRGGMDAVL